MEKQEQIHVKIKAPNVTQDVVMSLGPTDTVGAFRKRVISEFNYEGKNVRMISSGKLLDPDSASIEKFGINEGSFVHIVVSDRPSGSVLTCASSSLNQSRSQPSVLPVPSIHSTSRGFDRLMVYGMSVEETAALRSSFRSQVDVYSRSHPPHTTTSSTDHSNAPSTRNGDSSGGENNNDDYDDNDDGDDEHDDDHGESGDDSDDDTLRSQRNPLLGTHTTPSPPLPPTPSPSEPETATEYRFRMEEEWIESQRESSEFYMNLPPSVAMALLSNDGRLPGTEGGNGRGVVPRGSRYDRLIAQLTGDMGFRRDVPIWTQLEASIAQRREANGENTTRSSGSSGSSVGSSRDFMWGFLLGFTLGFLMIFCVWDRNVSQRQKAGIMCGVSVHMLSAYWGGQQDHTATNSSGVAPNSAGYLRASQTASHPGGSGSSGGGGYGSGGGGGGTVLGGLQDGEGDLVVIE